MPLRQMKCLIWRMAIDVIDKYLQKGAVAIAEQKFGVECDSPGMQRIYELAAHNHVPC